MSHFWIFSGFRFPLSFKENPNIRESWTDPKDRIAAFTVYTQATRFDEEGDARKAEEGYLQSTG